MPITTVKKEAEEQQSEFAQLLEKHDTTVIPQEGEVVEGKVISASKSEVLLDIDGLTTGIIRGPELEDESGEYSHLKIGDTAEATVIEIENEKGIMELSFRFAGHMKAWGELERLMKEDTVVDARIEEANKGGLLIRVGRVKGFLPVSQLTIEHYPRVEGGNKQRILERLQTYVNSLFKVKIIDVNEDEEKLIVSEKAAWEEKQQDAISGYKIGNIIEGTVSGVVDFGAFVEFGEALEGLVHISELAWQRIDDPREVIKVGEKVQAEIIGIDKSKISLSIKKLIKDPWKGVKKKYKIGQLIKGLVLKVNPFGAFVELDRDIHGLAHISELSHKKINSPSDIVKEGSLCEFKIISIEPENHRLGLSIKALQEKEKPAAKKEDGDAKIGEKDEKKEAIPKTEVAVTEKVEPGESSSEKSEENKVKE